MAKSQHSMTVDEALELLNSLQIAIVTVVKDRQQKLLIARKFEEQTKLDRFERLRSPKRRR